MENISNHSCCGVFLTVSLFLTNFINTKAVQTDILIFCEVMKAGLNIEEEEENSIGHTIRIYIILE